MIKAIQHAFASGVLWLAIVLSSILTATWAARIILQIWTLIQTWTWQ